MNRTVLSLAALVTAAAPLAAQHGHPAPAPPTPVAPAAPTHAAPAAPAHVGPAAPAHVAPGAHAHPAAAMPAAGMHQGDMHGPGMGAVAMDSMMFVMHRVQAFAPARVLERAQDLGLSAEQRSRVEAIGREAAAARDGAMATAMAHQRELADALAAGTPEPAAAEAHFAAAHAAMGAAHLADLRAAIAVMGLLTDLQRGRLGAAGAAPCPGCGTMPQHR